MAGLSETSTLAGVEPESSDPTGLEQEAARPAVAGWVSFVFVAAGLAIIPWDVYLALTLPRTSTSGHYRVAWVGFDVLLALALLQLGRVAARGPTVNDRVELPATAAATLLLVDAWFDATTSADPASFLSALILALVAELPLAAVCGWIAWHAEAIREQRLQLLPFLEKKLRS
jgi:hypothetical protein